MITSHPDWPQIRTYLRAEAYDRDTNPTGDVRHRIEVDPPRDPAIRAWLLGVTVHCPHCGRRIQPIRQRQRWQTWYYAAACPLDVNVRCARSRDAAAEVEAIVADLRQTPVLLPLFPEW